MPIERLILLGGGGHAKVVADAARLANPGLILEVRDDDREQEGALVLGVAVRVPIGAPEALRDPCHVTIGDNAARRRIGTAVRAAGGTLATVIHPRAAVASQAMVGDGAFIAAGAIVNHGAIVDHDCTVGAWTHVAPSAVLGGGVAVGAECLIGSGAVVLPGVAVGDGAVIGSGAVVTRNVAPGAVVVGVPGKVRHE